MKKKDIEILTQPMFYLLLSLKEERYGYEIMQYIKELTDGRVIVGPGTLYSLLGRFEEDGYIKIVKEEDKKKIYKISYSGNKLLEKEINRLELLLKDAKSLERGE